MSFNALTLLASEVSTRTDLDACYDILGLPRGADFKEVRRAYLSLARRYHSDKDSSPEARASWDRMQNAYVQLMEHFDNVQAVAEAVPVLHIEEAASEFMSPRFLASLFLVEIMHIRLVILACSLVTHLASKSLYDSNNDHSRNYYDYIYDRAIAQGIPAESLSGLSAQQIRAMCAGLTREQVLAIEEFGYQHAFAAELMLPYRVYAFVPHNSVEANIDLYLTTKAREMGITSEQFASLDKYQKVAVAVYQYPFVVALSNPLFVMLEFSTIVTHQRHAAEQRALFETDVSLYRNLAFAKTMMAIEEGRAPEVPQSAVAKVLSLPELTGKIATYIGPVFDF